MTNPQENGHAEIVKDPFEVLDDWIFWVGSAADAGVLARCTEIGLTVDTWDRPGVGETVKGRRLILVFNSVGEDRECEFVALGLARSSGAIVRVWKPALLGDPETPDLVTYAARYDLAKILYFNQPWRDKPPNLTDRRPGWPLTDLGNAERMASRYGSVMRYCKPWKKWLVWTGQQWENDDTGKVNTMAKHTVRSIYEDAAAELIADEREKIAKWAFKCEEARRIESMLKLVWSEPNIPIIPARLDPNPWLLNCQNGTINLKTGFLQVHSRADLITRMAPVEYQPHARGAIWDSFLAKILPEESVRRFVQRLFGIALTGDSSEQILPIFWGSGANGKSTLLGALISMLGPDYAIESPPGLLFTRQSDSHPTDRATLFGKRLVVDMESAEDARLNEALVKQLTGSDKISARRMREDFWSFHPTHTLFLGTNHKPDIQETKNAIWRRVKLVPFTVEIPEEDQNRDLPEQLKDEYPAILAWAVQGCLEWQRDGLMTPAIVEQVTLDYRKDQDSLATFFTEECVLLPSLSCRASRLYGTFKAFTERSGEKVPSQKVFGGWLKERGFTKFTNDGVWYNGIDLRQRDNKSSDHDY